MRKLIIAVSFLFFAASVKAQYIPQSGAYSSKGFRGRNSMQFPTLNALPVTAINAPDSNYAALYFNTLDQHWYAFNPVTKTWSIWSGAAAGRTLPFNGDTAYYLAGDSTLHKLPQTDFTELGTSLPVYFKDDFTLGSHAIDSLRNNAGNLQAYKDSAWITQFAFPSSTPLILKTNNTNNGSQTTLNLANGLGIIQTDNGSGTVTTKADTAYLNTLYSNNGTDTSFTGVTVDSTGQPQNRILIGIGKNHIGSYTKLITDSTKSKVVINNKNISYGGSAKLAVKGNVFADKYIVSGGTSSQFLKGDGSLDANTYLQPADTIGKWIGLGWLPTLANANTILRITNSDFTTSVNYVNTSLTGKVPYVFYNNVNKYLQFGSDYDTLSGGGIKLLNFTVASGDIYYIIGSNLVANIGGSGGSVAPVQQDYTSGATVTVTNGVDVLNVNPASTLASSTITLPATANTDGFIEIYFGGTLTSGAVVTSLTISPNTGQTIIQAAVPTSANAGEYIKYRLIGTTWRSSN
jgi:hypothetical protein